MMIECDYESSFYCISKITYPKEKEVLYVDPLRETPAHLLKCKDMTRQVLHQMVCLNIIGYKYKLYFSIKQSFHETQKCEHFLVDLFD